MTLLFIWIDSFRNIQKQGFNFFGKYHIEFKPESEELIFKINKEYIDHFFNFEQPGENIAYISNITGIVGENGSGKTSVFEFFYDGLRTGDMLHPEREIDKDLIAFQVDNRLVVFHQNVIKVIQIPNEDSIISLNQINPAFHIDRNSRYAHYLVPIFYSTSMYDRVTHLGVPEFELMNISNLFMYYHTFSPLFVDRPRASQYKKQSSPGSFKDQDFKRQIQFVNENLKNKIVEQKFASLPHFGIYIDQRYLHLPQFKTLFETYFEFYQPENDVEFLKGVMLSAAVLSLVYPEPNSFKPKDKENIRHFDIVLYESFSKEKTYYEVLNKFISEHPFYNYQEEFTSPLGSGIMYNYKLKEKLDFISFIQKNFKNENFDLTKLKKSPLEDYKKFQKKSKFFNPFKYYFKVELGDELLKLYLNQLSEITPDFLDVDWSDLSSGEIAFLNLFSRFYLGYDEFKKSEYNYRFVRPLNTDRTVLIFIDEGETYFHPQWQKEYLKLLIQFVQRTFKGRTVQIVIASNSAFITSDIPNYNIIYLEKNGEHKSIVSPNQKHQQSFAGNIHRLYKDAFFLKNGFMGGFATQKIQQALDWLNDTSRTFENTPDMDKDYYMKLIQIIGEPVLKEKMLEMWDNKKMNILPIE